MATTPSTTQPSPVAAGVLLTGGLARRMGIDKRLLVLGGRTLLVRGVRFLRDLVPRVAVSVEPGPAPDLGDAGDVTVLPDRFPGRSPLVGIATALYEIRAPVFISAVDLAFPDPDIAGRILAECGEADVCLPELDGRLEPLFGIYDPRCLPAMIDSLKRGEHRIVDCFAGLRVKTIPLKTSALRLNINAPTDFADAQRQAVAAELPLPPALVAIVGKSDSGKTTVVERLLPELRRLGLRVGTVKHDAHNFDIDHPGKDSYRHAAAGAEAYVVSSPSRVAYVGTVPEELSLVTIARRFFQGLDLVVAEGYKRTAPHRIEVFRLGAGHAEPLCVPEESMALVTDSALPHPWRLALDDASGLASFIALRLDTLREY